MFRWPSSRWCFAIPAAALPWLRKSCTRSGSRGRPICAAASGHGRLRACRWSTHPRPPRGHDSAGALKLVADSFVDDAAGVALDQVGYRPPARQDAAVNLRRSTGRRARTSTLGLANHPGLSTCAARPCVTLEQVVIGPANHSYTGSNMRVKHCATVLFRYARHHQRVVIGIGSPSWLSSRNRLMII